MYYENNPTRLSACPLTIHALLHIAWGIKVAGPVWTYWAYPMERHCNVLLQAIKSRRRPFASINSFVTATAQLDQIRLSYNLYEALRLDPDKKENIGFTHDSCKFSPMISAIDAHLPLILFSIDPLFLLATPRRCEILPPPIRNKVWACLSTRFNVQKKDVQSILKLDQPITQYGRVCRLEGGDRMIGRHFVKETEDSRDSSFVRVEYSLFLHICYV